MEYKQKSCRRRCRSEGLASAPPSLGLQIERYTLKHNSDHFAKLHNRNTYSIKPSHQLKVQDYAAGPTTKENLTNGGSQIIDIKETYLREMDAYKERLGAIRPRTTAQVVPKGDPRNTIFDANRRRIRARSESEPHELYSVSHNLRNGGVRDSVSVFFKCVYVTLNPAKRK